MIKAIVEVYSEPSHDGDLVEHYEKAGYSIVEPITSFLFGHAEHTCETKEEDDYGKDQFGDQAGVVLDFRHAFDVPYFAALREWGHEKAEEQERTLDYYHPSDGF